MSEATVLDAPTVTDVPAQPSPPPAQTDEDSGLPESVQAFLDARGKPPETPEGTAAGEDNGQPEYDEVTAKLIEAERADAEAKAKEQARKELDEEAKAQRAETQKKADEAARVNRWRTTANETRAMAQEWGLSQADTNALMNKLTLFYQDAMPLAQRTVWEALGTKLAEQLPEDKRTEFFDAGEFMPPETPQQVNDFFQKWATALEAKATQGRHTDSDLKKAEAKAVYDYHRDLVKKGLLPDPGHAPRLTDASGGNNRWLSQSEIDAMPTNDWLSRPKEWRDAQLDHLRR